MMSKKNLRPSYLKMKHVISVPHESSAENAKIMNAQVMTKVYRKSTIGQTNRKDHKLKILVESEMHKQREMGLNFTY